MSAITEQIRAEHRLDTGGGCICGAKHPGGKGWWSKHIATVTEAATRAETPDLPTRDEVAYEIEVYASDLLDQASALLAGELTTDQGRDLRQIYRGLRIAARIARGGAGGQES